MGSKQSLTGEGEHWWRQREPFSQAGGMSPFALTMKSVMCRFLSSPGGWGKECGLGKV